MTDFDLPSDGIILSVDRYVSPGGKSTMVGHSDPDGSDDDSSDGTDGEDDTGDSQDVSF